VSALVEVVIECPDCGARWDPVEPCPGCGLSWEDVAAGRDLLVRVLKAERAAE
jgi:Zn finger protein HypA/HybF involved in hydrogenase expression